MKLYTNEISMKLKGKTLGTDFYEFDSPELPDGYLFKTILNSLKMEFEKVYPIYNMLYAGRIKGNGDYDRYLFSFTTSSQSEPNTNSLFVFEILYKNDKDIFVNDSLRYYRQLLDFSYFIEQQPRTIFFTILAYVWEDSPQPSTKSFHEFICHEDFPQNYQQCYMMNY